MADVVKQVNRTVPIQGRNQSFTEADADAGDVILIEESLGRSAKVMTVESAGGMQIRVNVYHVVAPPRIGNDLMYTEGMPNLAFAERVKDSSMALITIDPDETFVLDDGLIIRDVELVTVSGVFEILVT